MALLTLAEGNKYSRTELERVVVDLLVKESPILEKLQFEELLGNSLTYNQVTTRSTASFYDVGDTWGESTPVLTPQTVVLKILGEDADVDNFVARTRSNIIDVLATILEDKVKAVQEKFLDTFYYGVASGTKTFDGLHTLIASTTYNTVHAGAGTGTALSMLKLDEAIDMIKGFKPQLVVMSKLMRRRITVYLNSVGDKFTAMRNDLAS